MVAFLATLEFSTMKNYIPNILTLTNVFFGCLALLCLFNGNWDLVPLFWAIGLFFDFTDGMVARALNVKSPIGKELDSLADMVTFGVLPGAILYFLLVKTLVGEAPVDYLVYAAFPGFLITLFSALRLAKFNIDTRQSEDFIGLATPANTGYFIGLLMINQFNPFGIGEWVLNLYLLYGSAILFSYLLIAEIPMFSLKFKHMKWRGNEMRYVFLISCILLIATLGSASFPPGIILYLVLTFIENARNKNAELSVESGK